MTDHNGSTPPDFSHWEPASSKGAPAGLKLAVDTRGVRWWKSRHDSHWSHAPQDFMSSATWREHVAGLKKGTNMTNSGSTAPNTDARAGSANGAPTAEATGIRGAIAVMQKITDAHAGISNSEGFLASLKQMDVGTEDRQRFLDAQQASKSAEQAWQAATDTIRRHNDPLYEAYRQSPGAGNKHANTNE